LTTNFAITVDDDRNRRWRLPLRHRRRRNLDLLSKPTLLACLCPTRHVLQYEPAVEKYERMLFSMFHFVQLQRSLKKVVQRNPRLLRVQNLVVNSDKFRNIVFDYSPFRLQRPCWAIPSSHRLVFTVVSCNSIPEGCRFLTVSLNGILRYG
jgi:hypothetical protein